MVKLRKLRKQKKKIHLDTIGVTISQSGENRRKILVVLQKGMMIQLKLCQRIVFNGNFFKTVFKGGVSLKFE